jgi:para-nitrobenzyl esterase
MPRALLACASCILMFVCASVSCHVIRMTSSGAIRGFLSAPVSGHPGAVAFETYLGIPYAETTGGANRWRPPVPKGAWTGVFDATKPGPICPQGQSFNEDCLSLNIFAPASSVSSGMNSSSVPTDSAARFPVAVWIHGGGFMFGASSLPIYRGDVYASTTNTVIVTLNYRLGALGFLAGTAQLTGNYGLMDQQLALAWVQKNIASFGGDPGAVTLFGQSAGGISALTHLVMPSSAGLFQRVLIESSVGLQYQTELYNRGLASTLATLLLCGVDDMACLRSRTAHDIVSRDILAEYALHLRGPNGEGISFLQWMPTVDGVLLPADPLTMIARGDFHRVPIVLGSVTNETNGWVPLPSLSNNSIVLDALFGLEWPSIETAVKQVYADIAGDPFRVLATSLSDYLVTCYVRHIALGLVASGHADVSLYTFAHVPSAGADVDVVSGIFGPNCLVATCHASELQFVFGSTPFIANASFTPAEVDLSHELVASWSSFFNQSAPVDRKRWPAFTADSEVSNVFDVFPDGRFRATTARYHFETCSFWQKTGWIF